MTWMVDNITVDCADPGDPEIGSTLDSGVTLLFIVSPEPKTIKNRMHLCLTPDIRREDGSGWAVLQDPEGNEFCVLRSAAEKAGRIRSRSTAPTGTTAPRSTRARRTASSTSSRPIPRT